MAFLHVFFARALLTLRNRQPTIHIRFLEECFAARLIDYGRVQVESRCCDDLSVRSCG